MSTIDTSTGLGALVTAHPELARELERRGLDYCCGGARSLGEACRALDLDPEVTAQELSMALVPGAEPDDWAGMGPVELVDHLEATHHRYLWAELPRLTDLVAKIESVHGERHGELHDVAACFGEIRSDLEPHLLKEERVLFPAIRELAETGRVGSVPLDGPISVMLREHDRVGDLLARLRDLTDGYRVPDDGCGSYRACYEALAELEADLHLHIHKENNVLFPAVAQLEAERSVAR